MAWLFGYLLTGFFFHFLGASVWKFPNKIEWYWELMAIAFWPLAICLAICRKIADR